MSMIIHILFNTLIFLHENLIAWSKLCEKDNNNSIIILKGNMMRFNRNIALIVLLKKDNAFPPNLNCYVL